MIAASEGVESRGLNSASEMNASSFLLTVHIPSPDRQPARKIQAKRHIVAFEAKKAIFPPSSLGIASVQG